MKGRCEDPGSSYSFGWSHGREAMAEGSPDTMKGSYYGNPLQDNRDAGEELAAQFPSYCRCRGAMQAHALPLYLICMPGTHSSVRELISHGQASIMRRMRGTWEASRLPW